MLFKTAMRQKALMLVACIMLGTASARAVDFYTFAIWDETTGTLYFDCDIEIPTVGSTWTTSQNETITVSQIWSGDEVLSYSEAYGWVTDDIQNACTKVVIGDMGEDTPKFCNRWFYNFSNLTSIEGFCNLVTKDVKSMESMFAGCAKLTSLNLIGFETQNVSNMVRMFSGCTKLSELFLSTFDISSLRFIDGMFENCTSLKTIYVDESLWNTDGAWGTDMFSGCTSLVGGNGTVYDSENTGVDYAQVDKKGNPGYLTAGAVFAGWNSSSHQLTFGFGDVPRLNYLNDEGIFTQVWYGKEALNRSWADAVRSTCSTVRFASSFSRNVKGINMNDWFSSFSKLETVERFDYVTPGSTEDMFWDCSKLSSISLSSTLKRIDDYMFKGCSSLTRLYIPKSVTFIGSHAFEDCTGLTSITIPVSVTSIENYAFSDCNGLTSIIVESGNTKYDSRDNCNAIIETESNTLISGCPNTTIPGSVTSIGEGAFYECRGLTSVTIPDGVTTIGRQAFSFCSGLTSVTIPNSVTSIKKDAFWGCTGLTSVTIGDGVTFIGSRAFYECTGLTSITIPGSVTSIGESAFYNCTSLKDVYCLAEKVPTTESNAFYNSNIANATLHVPAVAIDAYRDAEPWNQFKEIVSLEGDAKGDLNGDGVVDANDLVALVNMIAAGDASATADLNDDGVVNAADVVKLANIIMGK